MYSLTTVSRGLDTSGFCSRSLLGILVSRRHEHRMSQLYRPSSGIPEKEKEPKSKKSSVTSSKSHKLMVDLGVIHSSSTPGAYTLLPIALRSLKKLTGIVDFYMSSIGAQRIQLPTLTSAKLWKATGRIDGGPELMKMEDRHGRQFLISPTHEEAVCDLVRGHPINFKNLPLRLYQITGKFRDEMRPRYGLIRGREFLMKDLYTFDKDEKTAMSTYEEILGVYSNIFDHIGVPWVKAMGATGMIGGSLSHEFHLPAAIGDDEILSCDKCSSVYNIEILRREEEAVAEVGGGMSDGIGGSSVSLSVSCPQCGSANMTPSTSIEVGHSFLLGTKYTKPLGVTYTDESTKKHPLLEMGCYGLGMTRLLGAVCEVLSKEDELRWPLYLSPYFFGIIPPKAGSKEEMVAGPLADKLLAHLNQILPGETLVDDRTEFTIGKRFKDFQKLGIPYVIVLGKNLAEKERLIEFTDVYKGTTEMLPISKIFNYLYDLKSQWKLL